MVIFIAYMKLKKNVYTQTVSMVERYRACGWAKELSAKPTVLRRGDVAFPTFLLTRKTQQYLGVVKT